MMALSLCASAYKNRDSALITVLLVNLLHVKRLLPGVVFLWGFEQHATKLKARLNAFLAEPALMHLEHKAHGLG